MKKFLILVFCVMIAASCSDSATSTSGSESVIKYDSPAFGVSFEAREQLDWYQTESDSVIGYENDNYAVDIEVLFLDPDTEDRLKKVKYHAREIAVISDFSEIRDKPECISIDEATCVLANDEYGVPVYIIASYNYTSHLGYEITIYCYDSNLEEGARIAKSFQVPD